ncbi:hypothetical protein TPHA_0E01560 [Tetrapisispora phaffii CBS 4417]|uniref:Uncharacterized protein n=1 Tax=Tetrapisispora phaffii (strain ATCC 24235 / CBS 4417 / NBRC 1672 / NRRL Y-8282 / UCD 70-5) TaxID=1071381 RepID=G8BTM1_TETPH|nr:hypothetical protein TPHA_0E01560 [Tetrapisispora phaffii CBS 4417]CCE63249.1 hypothetical protein TPHA_0E01560 [Tetrapisispora phaffii CBS 4417]
MYSEILDYIEKEVNNSVNTSINNISKLDDIPHDLLYLITQEYNKNQGLKLSQNKKDLLAKNIYDLEQELRRSQILQINEFVGEVPKYSIGTEILKQNAKSKDLNDSISINKLISDIFNLPQMSLVRGLDEDTEDEQEKKYLTTLNEYNNIRDELTNKCTAIIYGESILKNIHEDTEILTTLFKAIEQFQGSETQNNGNSNPSTYLNNYNSDLKRNLQELELLLEETVKSRSVTKVTKEKIDTLFNNL